MYRILYRLLVPGWSAKPLVSAHDRIMGTHTAYIEPGSPWENPYIESFNGRLRDECLNTEDFADLLEARVVLEDWRTEYSAYRPHQSLGGTPPPPTLTTGHTNTNQHTHSTLSFPPNRGGLV